MQKGPIPYQGSALLYACKIQAVNLPGIKTGEKIASA